MHGWLTVSRVLLVAACVLAAGGCELVLRFDRDRIEDSGVRLDGEVVVDPGK